MNVFQNKVKAGACNIGRWGVDSKCFKMQNWDPYMTEKSSDTNFDQVSIAVVRGLETNSNSNGRF